MQKFAICAPSHNFVGIFVTKTKACIDNREKLRKQQYFLHMHSQYSERRPTNG